MYVIRQGTRVSVSTPAKLNLFLELNARRADGFHELDSVMVPISLYDSLALRVRSDDQIRLQCDWALAQDDMQGGELPSPGKNIVYKALDLLRSRAGTTLGADVTVTKRIPSQAGMGGGSSDAMAALVAANEIWKLRWSRSQLADLGAEIGSDTPFFAYGQLARCTGRGERISTIRTGGRMHFVVVKPNEGLSTPEVFRLARVPDVPVSSQPFLDAAGDADWRKMGALFFNRLQSAARTLTDWVDQIGQVMDGLSVLGHQMSGSGTSYFALCQNKRHARLLAARLRATRLGQVFVANSLGLSPIR